MANWVIVEEQQGMQPIEVVDTVQNLPLGTRVRAKHSTYGEGEFIYLPGVASTVAGSAVIWLKSTTYYDTNLLAANYIGSVAFAVGACVAGSYGWYQIYGNALARTSSSASAYARCWISGSVAGEIDDATVDGDLIHNAKYTAATSAGNCIIQIAYPYVDDVASND